MMEVRKCYKVEKVILATEWHFTVFNVYITNILKY